MARRNKRRKSGARYPCGKLRPGTEGGVTLTLWQRIRADGLRLGADPKLGTELGRLGLIGELTGPQVTAGFRVAEFYGRFERAHGRKRGMASPSYEMGYGRGENDKEDGACASPGKKGCGCATCRFDNLQKALPTPAIRDLVERLCVDNEVVPSSVYLEPVRLALDYLAGIWRITAPDGRRHREVARPAPVAPPRAKSPRRVDVRGQERSILKAAVAILRPDLEGADLLHAVDIFDVLRERERFEKEKRQEKARFP